MRVGRWVVISFSRCSQHAVVVELEVRRPEVGLHNAEDGRHATGDLMLVIGRGIIGSGQ